MYQVCWKCKRSIEPLARREKDKKTNKVWLITYCPFERCAVNLDLTSAPSIKIWNQEQGFFEDYAD